MFVKLKKAGFEAYLVGGCVRDAVLGMKPHDYDITTNAKPEEIMKIFGEENCSEYGRAFGTVGVKYASGFAEITTYRTESDYTDCRHPGKVAFAGQILDDLSRRDFTCNAMAWNPDSGLLDPFGGEKDMKQKILRCVGVPSARFREDALRVLRGMRFCAKLGFTADPLTDAAMRAAAFELKYISAERIFSELCSMLMGDDITRVLLAYPEILAVRIPEIRPCIAFTQHSRHHDFTVWEHIARTVGNAPKNLTVRLTMLFHDISKPQCYTIDVKGGHFKTHAEKSAVTADKILRRLKSENHLREQVCRLIYYHRSIPRSLPAVRKILTVLTDEEADMLIEVFQADSISKHIGEPENDRIDEVAELFKFVKDKKLCCRIKDLHVSGNDMINLGFEGKKIGLVLKCLLGCVISEQVPNERSDLLSLAEYIRDGGLL